jgi:hypothetical protein
MRHLLTAFSCLIVLAGCSQETLLKKFATPEDEATAKQYVDHLRNRRFDEIEKVADASISGPNLRDVLMRMADMLPDREPDSVKLVGAHSLHEPSGFTKNLSFEYGFSGRWFLINVATREQAGKATIVGFNVYPQPAPLAEQHRFGLKGKTALQYAILALAAILPLLTLYALVVCVRTRMPGRKWPWVLFILAGVGKVAVNWTTGEWNVAPLSIQLFSAAAFAPVYGPWVVAVSFPLGALVFLLKRRSLAAR